MRAIYRYDGTIKGLTDSTEFGAVITEEQYANKTLYRVNPNTKEVYLVPTCEARFIRIVDSVITEFSNEEKAAILSADAAREAERVAQEIENRELEEAQEIENKERIRVETLKRELADIDLKSIRGIREFILTLQDAPERLKTYEDDAEKKRAEI